MVGLGTIINTLAILAGGVLGALFGRFLTESAQDTLTKVCGVSTLFIAVGGAMEGMLTVENGVIVSGGAMLIVGCLAIGGFIGQMRPEDVLIITADHGCDPCHTGTDHTREYIPVLVYGDSIAPNALGTLDGFGSIAATVLDLLGIDGRVDGESFADRITK